MDSCDQLHMSGWQSAILHHICPNFSTNSFSYLTRLQAPLTSTTFCHFSDIASGRGSQGWEKAKSVGVMFSSDQGDFDVVLKQFKLNTLIPLLSEILGIKGNNCCFIYCVKRLSHWHAFVCQIWYDDRYCLILLFWCYS